ncbi:hypothetical protein [Enterobacillus tribolii]|nr:hypothetical protein [Enterobacillus tribolii]
MWDESNPFGDIAAKQGITHIFRALPMAYLAISFFILQGVTDAAGNAFP